MTKQEFEERIDGTVSEKNYSIIEKVYTFHPAISNTEGKDQIAQIYKIGGMSIIRDMVKTAEVAAELEDEMRIARAKVSWIQRRQEMLAEGKRDYEEMLAEIEKAFHFSEVPEDYEAELVKIKERYPEYDVTEAQKMNGC